MAEILSTLSIDGKGTPTNGGDTYTLMSTWEAAQQGDLTGTDNPAGEPSTSILECYADWPSGLEDTCSISGWTTNEAAYITVRAAAGHEHGGVIGGGFWLAKGATVFTVYSNYVRVYDLEFVDTNPSHSGFRTVGLYAVMRWERNIARQTSPVSRACDLTTADSIIRNSLFINEEGAQAIRVNANRSQPLKMDNNTVIGTWGWVNTGIAWDDDQLVRNNVISGDVTGTPPTAFGSSTSNNAFGGTGAFGNNQVTGITTTDFVDYAGGDYNPTPGGALDGAGVDLSADFTDDITGQTRTQWDIGAYGIISAGGVTFDGPDIVNQTGTENQVFTFDENGEGNVASRFTGASSYALSPDSDPLPAGLSVNPTTGNIEGTPTESGTFPNIIIRGDDGN
jgi:hypothetical protein